MSSKQFSNRNKEIENQKNNEIISLVTPPNIQGPDGYEELL